MDCAQAILYCKVEREEIVPEYFVQPGFEDEDEDEEDYEE